MNKNYGLKIYYTSMFVIVFLMFIAILINYYLNKNLLFNETIDSTTKYNHYFESYNKLEINSLKSFINFISKNKDIENNFKKENKTQLYKITKPILESLYKDNSITHLYFLKPNGKVFLRVHQYEKDNDTIKRYTFLKAKENNSIFAGNEFGEKLNTFTLRVVYPWYINNKLIGYLEMGKEIDKISDEITKELNVDLYFLIKSDIYTKKPLNTNEISIKDEKYTLAYHTNNNNYKLDKSDYINSLDNAWIIKNNKYFIKTTQKLFDVSNKEIGYKLFLIDVSKEYSDLRKTMFFYASTLLFSALFIIVIGYIFSNRKQKELDHLIKRLHLQKTKVTKLYKQQKSLLSLFDKGQSVLFKLNNNDELTIDYVSKNVVKIFGYTKKEYTENKINIKDCIHPSDYERFQNELKSVLTSKDIYLKHEPYRVITKDGDIKWIRNYTVIIKDNNNEVKYFLGYLIDITKEYKLHQSLERFIETQENIVILTDGKKLDFANKKMFDFLGFKDLETFLKNHKCICELFVQDDRYFHLGKINDDTNWINYIEIKLDEPQKMVQIKDKNGIMHIFKVYITNFDESLKIVSFSDITETIENQLILEEKTVKDNLTGAFNRNYFEINQEVIIRKYTANEDKLAVAFIDIDHFKNVNDTFGHDIGDYVLKEFVDVIHNSIRQDDVLIRWGGEEFLLLLKIKDSSVLDSILNQIRIKIQNKKLDKVEHITCSIGASMFNKNKTIEETIKNADIGVYTAKKNGRNQVVLNIQE